MTQLRICPNRAAWLLRVNGCGLNAAIMAGQISAGALLSSETAYHHAIISVVGVYRL